MEDKLPSIYIWPEKAVYEGYMPDGWPENTTGAIPIGTKLGRLVLDLAIGWRSVSYTAQMPATAIELLYEGASGRSEFQSPDSSIVAFAERIIARLGERIIQVAENRHLH